MRDTGALVYVVDDDASAREGVAGLIRSAGLMAKTFASGEEFLAAPRPRMPSCLVLDVNLPGLNGLELQRELAKSGVQVPIIFLTGHGDIPMTVRALKAGAANFLTKPFDDEELLNAVRQCTKSVQDFQPSPAAGRDVLTGVHTKVFPPFRLDTINQCLWRRGKAGEEERVLLTPKAFAVLSYLVEHAGRLVTQDELLDAVWPDTFVQPEVLKYQIADIRSTAGRRPKESSFHRDPAPARVPVHRRRPRRRGRRTGGKLCDGKRWRAGRVVGLSAEGAPRRAADRVYPGGAGYR